MRPGQRDQGGLGAMTIKTIVAAAVMLAPALLPAAALAAPPVSSEQIVCDLTGDCSGNAGTPTRNGPKTRGFSIIHGGSTQAQAQTPGTKGHHARTQAAAPARAPRSTVGHANLAIAFLEGSAVLTSAGRRAADEFVKALQSPALAGKRFTIGGHTSAVGGRAYNQDLSERRAAAVVDYLVTQGADRARFDVKGFGFDQPIPGTAPSAPANRRVEVIALP
eukprot:gene10134-10202_t